MKKNKIIKTVLSVAVLSAIANSASAVPIGTAAETAIDNTAVINYTVGTTAQSPIASSPLGNSIAGTTVNPGGTPTTFLVDKKIDLLVTGGNNTPVTPGQLGATGTGATATDTGLSFTVQNEGNSTEIFTLTPSDSITPIVTGDNFNSTGCVVTATGPLPATTPVTLPASIASGDSITATVECDIPPSSTVSPTGIVINEEVSIVDLFAEVTTPTVLGTNTADCNTNNGTTGANEACTVNVVYADGTGTLTDTGDSTGGGPGDRNGKHSATSTYTINTASLSVQKTQAVTQMSFDLDDSAATPGSGNANEVDVAGGNHIPGATITYTITVSNAASASTATGVNISDTVPTTMSIVGTPTIVIAGNAAVDAITTGQVVTAAPFDLAADETAVLTIVALIN